MNDQQGWIKAVVSGIATGDNGEYAVATADGFTGSITFSLSPKCWKGNRKPEKGDVVTLRLLPKAEKGWRASEARF